MLVGDGCADVLGFVGRSKASDDDLTTDDDAKQLHDTDTDTPACIASEANLEYYAFAR